MNFDLNEEQEVVRDLARQIFEGQATTERVKAVEKASGFDSELWAQLAESGIQALCVPEEHGGSGFGPVEMSLVLSAQGRSVAPVPLWTTAVSAIAIADFGSPEQQSTYLPRIASGELVSTIALAEVGANDIMRPQVKATRSGDQITLKGFKPAVPAAQHSGLVLLPVVLDGAPALVLLDLPATGVSIESLVTTNHDAEAHLTIDTTVAASAVLGVDQGHDNSEILRTVLELSLVALASIQVGVCEGALAHTASHLSTRRQFGKPLAAFQATTQRAADGYITTEALRVTSINAAWRLAEGHDARRDVASAAYWACEGGPQVVTACQHLHGGIGSDVDYPVHRHFLWGIQIATVLGSASSHLARLGNLLARV